MLRSAFILALTLTLSAQSKPPRTEADLKLFYQRNCVACHGLDGSATAPDGKRLKGKDFTSAKDMAGTKDAGLAKTIRNGIFFGKVMPAFKLDLTDEEIQILVKEVVRKAVKGQPIASQVDPAPLVPDAAQPPKQ